MATNDLKNASIDLQHPSVLFAAGEHAGYWLGTTEETAFGCNSYRVCDGDRAVRIDPGNRVFFRQVRARVAQVIAPAQVTAMILCHQDYMASNVAARGFASKLIGLELAAILPQHGSIIPRRYVAAAVDYLRELRCGLEIICAGID